ncbi:MAG: hypothetical protein J6A67_03095 [Clostridia bacterium]|nr:hypothetical protein [Clostridia bacterium]
MKEYFSRIKENCKTWEIVVWWIFRGLMIYALIASIIGVSNGTRDMADVTQVLANFAAMFAWEVMMMFPKKSLFRYVPSYIQILITFMAFCGSFGGKFLNFYYDLSWWDSGMHFLNCGLAVLIGYETIVAMQKRDQKECSVSIVIFASLGFALFASTAWELFEFFADQFMCNPETGAIGDAQHWCYELAVGTQKEATLFDPIYPGRWPIMDTMADTVLNAGGAAIGWVVLKIFPFHHKGENDINKQIAQMNAKAENKSKKETVKK